MIILKDNFPCEPDLPQGTRLSFLNLTDVEACGHGDVADEENKHDAG